jgi:hypothetical protein
LYAMAISFVVCQGRDVKSICDKGRRNLLWGPSFMFCVMVTDLYITMIKGFTVPYGVWNAVVSILMVEENAKLWSMCQYLTTSLKVLWHIAEYTWAPSRSQMDLFSHTYLQWGLHVSEPKTVTLHVILY